MENGYLNFRESDLLGESLWCEFWDSGIAISVLTGVICHIDRDGLWHYSGITEYHVSVGDQFLV